AHLGQQLGGIGDGTPDAEIEDSETVEQGSRLGLFAHAVARSFGVPGHERKSIRTDGALRWLGPPLAPLACSSDPDEEIGTMALGDWLVADSDMHVMEPADLWQRYMDPSWGHAAPVGLSEIERDMRVKVKNAVMLRLGHLRPRGAGRPW